MRLAWLPSYWFMGLLSELSGAFPAEFTRRWRRWHGARWRVAV